MTELRRPPQAHGQIERADEHHIDSGHRKDLVGMFQTGSTLNVGENDGLLVGPFSHSITWTVS